MRTTLRFDICPNCNQSFPVTTADPHRKFCSRACFAQFRSRPAETFCIHCGKPISGAKRASHINKRRFCSRTCFFKHRTATMTIDCPCAECGKLIHVKLYKVKTQAHFYCSRKCTDLARRKITGELHHAFIGPDRRSRGANWNRTSREIFNRDGGICQMCHKRVGKKRWDYAIHHVKPYSDFNGDWISANQHANLVTLCRPCHALVEWHGVPCPKPLI